LGENCRMRSLYIRERNFRAGKENRRCKYLRVYIPRREAQDGRAHVVNVPWEGRLARLAKQQREERLEKRRVRELQKRFVGPGRGRHSVYADHELWDSVGCRRRGSRVHLRRSVLLEEHARARYALLEPDLQQQFTEDKYVEILLRQRSIRKRCNRLSLPYDSDQAFEQALQEVMSERNESS